MINFLLKEIDDRYVQENFKRLKAYLDDSSNVGGDTIINNNTTVINNGLWTDISDTVPSSSSKDVDTFDFATFIAAKHIVSVFNLDEAKYKSFEVSAIKSGAGVNDTVYNIQGQGIDYDLNVSVSLGQVKYTITNNESYPLTLSIRKLVY